MGKVVSDRIAVSPDQLHTVKEGRKEGRKESEPKVSAQLANTM